MSGHTTFRYGGVESHPFNFGSGNGQGIGGKAGRSCREGWHSALHSPRMGGNENAAPLPGGRASDGSKPIGPSVDRAPASSGMQTAIPDSDRDLAAENNLAIAASPAAAELVARQRSSSVPSASCRSSFKAGHKRRSTFPNDTATTLDLLSAFPYPPGSEQDSPSTHPRGKLTLFPRSSDENSPPKPEKVQSEQHALPAKGGDIDNSAPLASGALQRSNSAEEPTARAQTAPSVRGEDATRYRTSGVPIYTPEAASLRSVDNDEDGAAETNAEHSPGVVKTSAQSGRTGGSRYFSAASRALGTPAPAQSQRERAVANGAHRFSSSRSPLPPPAAENLVPITVTSHGREGCRHRSVKDGRKSVGLGGFDGAVEGEEGKKGRKGCLRCRVKRQLRRMIGKERM